MAGGTAAVDSTGTTANGQYLGPEQGVDGLRPGDTIGGMTVTLGGIPDNNLAAEFTASNGVVAINDPVLDGPETGSFSTELLFKPRSEGMGSFGELVSKGNCCTGSPSYYLLHWGRGIRWGINAVGPPDVIDAAEAPPLDEWSHIAATFDGETREAVLYINGEVSTEAILASPVNPSLGDLWLIGGLQMGPADSNFINQANGTIDEVSVYDRVLRADEVLGHFNVLFGGPLPPPP